MIKTTIAAAVFLGAAIVGANAAPLAPQTSDAQSSVTLVRDGCGPGFRFSFRRGRCVPAYYGGPGYYGPGIVIGGGRWRGGGGGGRWHGGGGGGHHGGGGGHHGHH